MAIGREAINQHKWLGVSIAILGPAIAIGSLWYGHTAERRELEAKSLAWYSDDDGHSRFSADMRTLRPPFDHNGKTANRAYVFTSDGGKTTYVAYLERYTPRAIKMLDWAKQMAESGPPAAGVSESIAKSGLEIKKPGDSTWINIADPRAAAIRKVRAPDGSPAQPVLP